MQQQHSGATRQSDVNVFNGDDKDLSNVTVEVMDIIANAETSNASFATFSSPQQPPALTLEQCLPESVTNAGSKPFALGTDHLLSSCKGCSSAADAAASPNSMGYSIVSYSKCNEG